MYCICCMADYSTPHLLYQSLATDYDASSTDSWRYHLTAFLIFECTFAINNVYSVKQHHISFSAFLWFFKANCEPFSEMIKIPANTYSYFDNRFRWACFNPTFNYLSTTKFCSVATILARTKLKRNSDSKSWSLKTVVVVSASFNENYYCLCLLTSGTTVLIFCNYKIWFLQHTNILHNTNIL